MIASRSRSSVFGRASLRAFPFLTILALTAAARPAFAGDGAAAAEVLFADAKRLVQEGKFAEACPKFEESQTLDPGMGTLYRLADCYEHVGRTASAWAAFLEVAGSAKGQGQQARADDAKKRADDLAPRLAKLVITAAEPELAGLVVKRGDVVVGRAQWNTPLPVDPGEVRVEASAPGRKTWRGSVTVAAAAAGKIDIPALDLEPVAPPAGAALPLDTPPPVDRAPSSLGTQRTVALVTGGVGVVALGVGSVFGIVSMSKKSTADKHCDASNVCDDAGLTARHDSITAGNLSSIGFVAGGILAATGVVLWLTAPPRSQTAAAGAAPRSLRAGIAPRWAGVAFQLELP